MKTAILVHGYPDKEEYFDMDVPSPSNNQWFPWLQHELLVNGILAQTPEMPDAWHPRYDKWKKVFELFPVDEETILIGHSCGAGFLVRWLSENKVKVGKVILVAPWLDPDHDENYDVEDFFDFNIDTELVSRTKGVTIFISDNDEKPMLETADLLIQKLPDCSIKRMPNMGHFTIGDMHTDKFPELLKEILN